MNIVNNLLFGKFFLLIGFFFITMSIIGVLRFKQLYNKMHAASLLESLGIPFFIISLIFLKYTSYSIFDLIKLIGCIFFIYLSSPLNTSCLALIKKSEEDSIFIEKNK